MKFRTRLIHSLQVWALRICLVVVPPLPRWGVLGLARVAGTLAYWFSFENGRIGMANLDHVFGSTKTQKEKKHILHKSMQNFALIMLDLTWFDHRTKERLDKYVHPEDSVLVSFNDRPQLAITGHMGNWEIMGQGFSNKGFPLLSVAAPLQNRKLDALFTRIRERTGQIIVPQRGAVRKMLKGLRKNYKVAVLLDQNTLPRHGGIFIDFFGLPVPISSAPASLAIKAQCEVAVGFCLPRPDGHYRAFVSYFAQAPKPEKNEEKQAVEDMMKTFAGIMEAQILETPEQWLWPYKRWKFITPGHDKADYPFYARNYKPRERRPGASAETLRASSRPE